MPNELFSTLMSQQLPKDAIVSTEGPVDMSGNFFTKLLAMLSGSPSNIALPNESGMLDPKLPQTPESLRQAFNESNKKAGR